ncbi:hypothetical protein PAPHI01_2393 [Pancytospora philotis]|nr:hypothetical protein PAPHI01_2393 [Pancytospora philotis]
MLWLRIAPAGCSAGPELESIDKPAGAAEFSVKILEAHYIDNGKFGEVMLSISTNIERYGELDMLWSTSDGPKDWIHAHNVFKNKKLGVGENPHSVVYKDFKRDFWYVFKFRPNDACRTLYSAPWQFNPVARKEDAKKEKDEHGEDAKTDDAPDSAAEGGANSKYTSMWYIILFIALSCAAMLFGLFICLCCFSDKSSRRPVFERRF